MIQTCPGDIANSKTMHADGIVNVFDLFALLANWNTDGLGADLAAPTNIVDVADLFVLCANWNCRVGNPYQALTLGNPGTVTDYWHRNPGTVTDYCYPEIPGQLPIIILTHGRDGCATGL